MLSLSIAVGELPTPKSAAGSPTPSTCRAVAAGPAATFATTATTRTANAGRDVGGALRTSPPSRSLSDPRSGTARRSGGAVLARNLELGDVLNEGRVLSVSPHSPGLVVVGLQNNRRLLVPEDLEMRTHKENR